MELDDQISTAHLLLETRICRVCKKDKNLLEDYYLSRKDPTKKSSYSYECKECTVKRTVEYNRKNSSSVKSQYLKRNYGLTFEEFESMLSDQNNCCAVCKATEAGGKFNKRFMIDKSPSGTVRGLLCNSCYTIVKEVGDDLQTLERMIKYLSKK